MIEVTPEKITWRFTLHTVEFPNNENLKMTMIDSRKMIGSNDPKFITLKFFSKDKTYKPWYGYILHIFYALFAMLTSGYFSSVGPLDIRGEEKIQEVLNELRSKGYDIDQKLKKAEL